MYVYILKMPQNLKLNGFQCANSALNTGRLIFTDWRFAKSSHLKKVWTIGPIVKKEKKNIK